MGGFDDLKISTHALLCFGIFICFCIYSFTKKKLNLPPGPTGLPIVGYLPFLGYNPPKELHKLSKKYGNVFSLNLGGTYVVVVTDVSIAKDLLKKYSVADRPDYIFQLMPGGVGFAESSGAEWNEQRRYTISEMKNLGFGRSDWEKLVEVEVQDFLDLLAKSQGQPLDINKALSASVSNNVLSLVTSNRLPMHDPRRDIIDQGVESFQLLNDQSGLISNFPRLFKFFVKLGLIKAREKMKDVMNMNRWIREEMEEIKQEKDGVSYIHKYFTEIEKNKQLNLGNSFSYANLIGNVQALIIAGSDTTKTSLLWLFLAMASFPDIQDKVQEEVDKEIGKDGSVNWIDRNKLPYCFATILEGQRWRTVAPLSLQHRTTEDLVVNGYDIPKGTNILTILSAFHNDTKYWKDPDTFQPERFLSDDGETVKEPESFIPFSYGKRVCPGKTVALIELLHYFVTIMQRFRILPESETKRPNLEGFPGLTLQPKYQPLRFVPR